MFKKLGIKQAFILFWWTLPQYKHIKQIVLNGAIRTGKTDLGFRSFFNWALHVVTKTKARSKGYNSFLIIGATKDTVYDNIIEPFIILLRVRGFKQVDSYKALSKLKKGFFHNSSNGRITLKYKKHKLVFKYLGANNKRAKISIQGGTRRGVFIDEAALIPMSAIENAIMRTVSFEDALIWHTTNPEGDEEHEYYKQYIFAGIHKEILVLSFELLDNPQYTQKHVDYYKKIFTATMFARKVLGKWVRGVGGIYQKFLREIHVHALWENLRDFNYAAFRIGIDYGESDATTFILAGILSQLRGIDILRCKYHRNSEHSYKTIDDYAEDFFDFVDMINEKFMEVYGGLKPLEIFVDSANLTVRNYLMKETQIRRYRNIKFIRVNKMQKLQKGHSDQNEQKAIKERIMVNNLLIGANMFRVDEDCPEVISAYRMAVWGKDGNRLDDNTQKFNPVDVLDAIEYTFLDLLKQFLSKIVYFTRNKKV